MGGAHTQLSDQRWASSNSVEMTFEAETRAAAFPGRCRPLACAPSTRWASHDRRRQPALSLYNHIPELALGTPFGQSSFG